MSRVRFESTIPNDHGGWTTTYRAHVPQNHGLAHDHRSNGPFAGQKQFILSTIIHSNQAQNYGTNTHSSYVNWVLPQHPDRVRIYRSLKRYTRPDVPQTTVATNVSPEIWSMDQVVPANVLQECEAIDIIFEWEAVETVMSVQHECFLPLSQPWPVQIWMYLE
ncbi:uncharacterized protein BKA78DRAFT_21077 [Phyllosticta capitalensis]|uniref:uncharacterized protein n=1 Tax=Phyllosticta capitalensis TaxID=121624 RepID=UPI00312E57C1